jgi:hypothetical protein
MGGGVLEECHTKDRLSLQTKLEINEPGNIYEQEADRVADEVMDKTDIVECSLIRQAPDEVRDVSSKVNTNCSPPVNSCGLKRSLNTVRSTGMPLPLSLRTDMENAFGMDFSSVRIHTDSQANEMSNLIRARAFTYGHDIYFNHMEFNPLNKSGRRLLAHELVHVVQQMGGCGVSSVSEEQGFSRPSQGTFPSVSHRTGLLIARVPIPPGPIDDLPRLRILSQQLVDLEGLVGIRQQSSSLRAVAELVDNQGNVYFSARVFNDPNPPLVRLPTTSTPPSGRLHAEEQLLDDFRNVPGERLQGGRLRVIVNDSPCFDRCRVALRNFARTNDMRVEAYILGAEGTHPANTRRTPLGPNRYAILVEDSSQDCRPLRIRRSSQLSRPQLSSGSTPVALTRYIAGLLSTAFSFALTGGFVQFYHRLAESIRERRTAERESQPQLEGRFSEFGELNRVIHLVFNNYDPIRITETTLSRFSHGVQYLCRRQSRDYNSWFQSIELEPTPNLEWLRSEFLDYHETWLVSAISTLDQYRDESNYELYRQRAFAGRSARLTMRHQLENIAQAHQILISDLVTIWGDLRTTENRYLGYIRTVERTFEALNEALAATLERQAEIQTVISSRSPAVRSRR